MAPNPGTWMKLYDDMPDHPKIEGLSDRAFRLLIETWCWCSRHLTDGDIPAGTWRRRGTPNARKELVDAGLIVMNPDESAKVHDYLDHQRSASEVVELSDKRREAGRRGGRAKAKALASAKQVPEQTPSKDVAEESRGDKRRDITSGDVGADAPRAKRATQLPGDWQPSEAHHVLATERRVNLAEEVAKFRDWSASNGATKKDWDATFRNWLRNARPTLASAPAARHLPHASEIERPPDGLTDAEYAEWAHAQAAKRRAAR